MSMIFLTAENRYLWRCSGWKKVRLISKWCNKSLSTKERSQTDKHTDKQTDWQTHSSQYSAINQWLKKVCWSFWFNEDMLSSIVCNKTAFCCVSNNSLTDTRRQCFAYFRFFHFPSNSFSKPTVLIVLQFSDKVYIMSRFLKILFHSKVRNDITRQYRLRFLAHSVYFDKMYFLKILFDTERWARHMYDASTSLIA